jgi:cell fate (sporulation/competence/biofilm development) regulator YlbF (YheA/YmcA/DUF963 family)
LESEGRDSSRKEIEALIDALTTSDTYKRLMELKQQIEGDERYLILYSDYLALQKKSVKSAVYGKPGEYEKQLEDKLALILSNKVVNEYIALIEELNDDVQAVQAYINTSLSID